VIPLIRMFTSAWLMLQVHLDAVLMTLALVIAGGVLYFVAQRKQSRPRVEA